MPIQVKSRGDRHITELGSSERYFLTMHEQRSITSALKTMYGLQGGEQASHKEVAPRRVKRDEEDIQKMMKCFSLGLTIQMPLSISPLE